MFCWLAGIYEVNALSSYQDVLAIFGNILHFISFYKALSIINTYAHILCYIYKFQYEHQIILDWTISSSKGRLESSPNQGEFYSFKNQTDFDHKWGQKEMIEFLSTEIFEIREWGLTYELKYWHTLGTWDSPGLSLLITSNSY